MPLVLAVPYLMPYAQLAGWAIGGLGLMEISKRVQVHMEENPEESLRILKMIMPQEGIAAMFEQLFNERGDDDELDEKEAVKEREEEVDFDEEIKPRSVKRRKSKKEIVLEALRKKKGSYASPHAEGSWASKRGRIIRGLKEEGKITDKPDPDYDPNKPKFNWRKFTRGRKADGGIMDVL